jgi:hypothetical protein
LREPMPRKLPKRGRRRGRLPDVMPIPSSIYVQIPGATWVTRSILEWVKVPGERRF